MNAFLLVPIFLLALGGIAPAASVVANGLPASDQRASRFVDLNTPRSFAPPDSRRDWEAMARDIREATLVHNGLWPMPPKTPLNARVTDRVERDGYTLEKVVIETRPGFFLAGNLYRPLGKGSGPFPAVLNPHGHGKDGRLHDDDQYSNPARCIQFARNGVIALNYDMVGYNDTMQLGAHRKFLLQPELQLWSLSLMGLQTWNSIRAVDFLLSLPDVDKRRIACTGESGGGTQTFLLGAADERLAAQAPVCMVSHSMQGGCQCENAPGLRVRYSNMEYAASPAPRPQVLVACTGDWTRATLKIEGPAIQRVYALFGRRAPFATALHPFNHNYNLTSRQTVYEWFNLHLLREPENAFSFERPYEKIPDAQARLLKDGEVFPGALGEEAFVESLIRERRGAFEGLLPKGLDSSELFRASQRVAWRHNLQLDTGARLIAQPSPRKDFGNVFATPVAFGRVGAGDRLGGVWFEPRTRRRSTAIVLANLEGKKANLTADGSPGGLAAYLVNAGFPVLVFDLFLTGDTADTAAAAKRKPLEKFFTTYNRTDAQERVQDLVTAVQLTRESFRARRVVVCGEGRAGLLAMLAAPVADGVVADGSQLDTTDDAVFMAEDIFMPGIRAMGGFEGVLGMAAPNKLLLHNLGPRFGVEAINQCYRAVRADRYRTLSMGRLPTEQLAKEMEKLF